MNAGLNMTPEFRGLAAHKREILRRIRNRGYEVGRGLIEIPVMKLIISGSWANRVVDRFGNLKHPWAIDPNIIPNEGLDYALDVALSNGSQLSTWYIAPFSGDVTPTSSYTASNFDSTATEFTNYDEASRQTWSDAGVASQSVDNSASTADFTISAGGGTVRGGALLSNSTKESTAGKIFACSRFSADRVLAEADVLSLTYTLSASSS